VLECEDGTARVALAEKLHASIPSEDDVSEGDHVTVELQEPPTESGDDTIAGSRVDDGPALEIVDAERTAPVDSLDPDAGGRVRLLGELVGIKQTGGPTIFSLADGTGIVPCAAFESAGERAYPDLDRGALVAVYGAVGTHDGALQVEADLVERLPTAAADAVAETVADQRRERAAPPTRDPLAAWEADGLLDAVADAAERIREAVLAGRPIRVRHHADGDGIAAAIPVARAVRAFVESVHADPDAAAHFVDRSPSKAPYYELEDAIRDLDSGLGVRERFGQRLPLVVLLDNGSTTDDVPAYELLDEYDVPVVAVDHHHPDDIDHHLAAHVNPYRHGADYDITTGMCAVELARLIDPEADGLDHVPAVAGIADHSAAPVMEEYLALAADAGYDRDDLSAIGDALDYASHHLRYAPGLDLMSDVLGVTDAPIHDDLVAALAGQGTDAIEAQLDATVPHVERVPLENGADCFRVDLSEHAVQHTYPAPGKTTGAIHDRLVAEHGTPAITIGIGTDFAVLRSDGVRLDIPRIVDDLADRFDGAGVGGGGHLVVGSIDFVPGKRGAVIEGLIDELGAAEIDAALGSARRGD
jgi:RecJ-like exonuclease